MKKKLTISIGIPAYNEQENIKQLLFSLCNQKEEGFILKEIIVISDGSSDDTVKKVTEVQDKRIHLVVQAKRKGKSFRLNELFQVFSGDVLFILDADIMMRDPYLLSKIIDGSDFSRDGIIGINTIPLLAHTSFEKIISVSTFIIRDIAMSWNNGRNYLTFRGCFLGLDGNYARSIILPKGLINDDAYLYLLARQKGYRSRYVRNATVFFRSPGNFADHQKQSSRYQKAQQELAKYFTENVADLYKIPLAIAIKSTLRYLFLYPFEVISYLVVRLIAKIFKQKDLSSRWAIAQSTKVIVFNELFFF